MVGIDEPTIVVEAVAGAMSESKVSLLERKGPEHGSVRYGAERKDDSTGAQCLELSGKKAIAGVHFRRRGLVLRR